MPGNIAASAASAPAAMFVISLGACLPSADKTSAPAKAIAPKNAIAETAIVMK